MWKEAYRGMYNTVYPASLIITLYILTESIASVLSCSYSGLNSKLESLLRVRRREDYDRYIIVLFAYVVTQTFCFEEVKGIRVLLFVYENQRIPKWRKLNRRSRNLTIMAYKFAALTDAFAADHHSYTIYIYTMMPTLLSVFRKGRVSVLQMADGLFH